MLKNRMHGLVANTQTQTQIQTQPQQIPHRAPVPQWANGDGEFGGAREGETRPATNGVEQLFTTEVGPRFNTLLIHPKLDNC